MTYQYIVNIFRSSLEDVATAQRQPQIAKQRGMGLFEILSHELLQYSPSFYFDLPDKAITSRLLAGIEHHLGQNSRSSVSNLIWWRVIASAKHACKNELLHVILDSYCEMSLKEGNW